MAYKFQLGEAKLSGSITQTDGAFTGASTIDASGDLTVGSITMTEFTVDSSGNTDIDGTLNVEGVPTFQAGAVFSSGITTAGAIAGATTISGSGNISSGGSFFGAGIGLSDASGIIASGGGLEDASGEIQIASSGVTNTMLSGAIAADKLQLGGTVESTSGELDVKFGAGLDADGSGLIIAAGGVTNTMLSGSITAEKLQLGNGLEDNAGFVQINLDGASSGLALSGDGIALASTIPSDRTFSANVTIGGNLTVQGSTTTIDSTTINISSSFTFEGPADDFETTLHAGTPTQDATIYLPQISGSGAQTGYLLALANDPGATALTATRANLDLMAAGAGSSVTLADGDSIVIFDTSDSDNPKKVLMSDIQTYAAAGSALSVASKADGNTLATGMNFFADLSSAATVTLPGSPEVGDLVYVKAGNLTLGATITVNRAGSQTIDGDTGILLESPYAAVTLIYVASNDWRIV